MARKISKNPADYIVPLNINGLEGRMLHLPAPKSKDSNLEMLFIYGHHSTIERWWGLARVFNRYHAVTMPDLPGFGGMNSFYSIGKKPTIDNLADYLAAFVKLRYKRKKIIIVGMSFGFVIATRMLQRYPELAKKVVLMVSLAGFAHKDDFIFTKTRHSFYILSGKILSLRVAAGFFRYIVLRPFVIKNIYSRMYNAKHKLAQAESMDELERLKDVEIGLWHSNDIRTWAFTSSQFLRLDNCGTRVNLPVWHVGTKNDHYFDNHLVEQHMRVVFNDFKIDYVNLKAHAPSVLADEKAAALLVPKKLSRVLAKQRG